MRKTVHAESECLLLSLPCDILVRILKVAAVGNADSVPVQRAVDEHTTLSHLQMRDMSEYMVWGGAPMSHPALLGAVCVDFKKAVPTLMRFESGRKYTSRRGYIAQVQSRTSTTICVHVYERRSPMFYLKRDVSVCCNKSAYAEQLYITTCQISAASRSDSFVACCFE